jgi:hypothetical protein
MQSPSTIIDYGVVSETMDVEFDAESDVNGPKEVRDSILACQRAVLEHDAVLLFGIRVTGCTLVYNNISTFTRSQSRDQVCDLR